MFKNKAKNMEISNKYTLKCENENFMIFHAKDYGDTDFVFITIDIISNITKNLDIFTEVMPKNGVNICCDNEIFRDNNRIITKTNGIDYEACFKALTIGKNIDTIWNDLYIYHKPDDVYNPKSYELAIFIDGIHEEMEISTKNDINIVEIFKNIVKKYNREFEVINNYEK